MSTPLLPYRYQVCLTQSYTWCYNSCCCRVVSLLIVVSCCCCWVVGLLFWLICCCDVSSSSSSLSFLSLLWCCWFLECLAEAASEMRILCQENSFFCLHGVITIYGQGSIKLLNKSQQLNSCYIFYTNPMLFNNIPHVRQKYWSKYCMV